MSSEFDVVIVGGGLAGSAMASVLAGDGLDVLVLERETAFRDRVRGEWLAPWGIVELEALGLRHVADSVPRANLITHHVSFDDTIAPEQAEAEALDVSATIPGGGCLALGHPDFQEALLQNAVTAGATVRRGVRSVVVTPGEAPVVRFEHDGHGVAANCRLVVAADGRESAIRKRLGIELESTTPQFMMAGMLVDDTHDWPETWQTTGVNDDFHFLIFPQAEGRVRVYGGWDIDDTHRFSGPGREQRFLESFRMACLPVPDAIADGSPAGPLAAYPMTDTWTDVVALDGVVLVGDSAGWSDPVIGQGMSVTFRDVHMAADVIRGGSDWSADAFASYAEERRERMRRLRFASAGGYLRHSLGPAGAERRRRLHDKFVEDPGANPGISALVGAWVLPESAYSHEAWNALLAV